MEWLNVSVYIYTLKIVKIIVIFLKVCNLLWIISLEKEMATDWHREDCCSVTQSCLTLCNPMNCSTLGFPVHHQLWQLAQTHVYRVHDAIQPSHPLSSLSPPTFSLSQHQGLFHEWVLRMRWPKYWSFSFSISPSNEYSGLISLSIDWFELLAVQGTLKSLLQHHSSKASFFGSQVSLWSNSRIHTWLLEKP